MAGGGGWAGACGCLWVLSWMRAALGEALQVGWQVGGRVGACVLRAGPALRHAWPGAACPRACGAHVPPCAVPPHVPAPQDRRNKDNILPKLLGGGDEPGELVRACRGGGRAHGGRRGGAAGLAVCGELLNTSP